MRREDDATFPAARAGPPYLSEVHGGARSRRMEELVWKV
jgi:hypothetical protein